MAPDSPLYTPCALPLPPPSTHCSPVPLTFSLSLEPPSFHPSGPLHMLSLPPWLSFSDSAWLVPFQSFFLHMWVPFLEKHFLIAYIGYFWLLRCTFSLSLPSPGFWDALTGSQAPWFTAGIRRSEGGEGLGIYPLSSSCDESLGWAVSVSWDLLPKRCFLWPWTASSCAL